LLQIQYRCLSSTKIDGLLARRDKIVKKFNFGSPW